MIQYKLSVHGWHQTMRDSITKHYGLAASALSLLATLWYGWSVNGGDISYGRLNKIPWQEVQWYHAAAPLILVALTRMGVPVSTSFLVLSVFASTFVLEKMLMKSIMGYGVAAAFAYVVWFAIHKYFGKWYDETKPVAKATKSLANSTMGSNRRLVVDLVVT